MIPTQPHIDITPILSPLVGNLPCRIPAPSNLFPSPDDIRIESPIAPCCATTCPVDTNINPYDYGTTACSHHVWTVSQVRPNQMIACRHLADLSKPQTLLLCDRCGSGKTHVTRIAGVTKKGIKLVIVPLITLAADQLSKFVDANQAYGTVKAHHVNKEFNTSWAKYNELQYRIRVLGSATTSTVFLFRSP